MASDHIDLSSGLSLPPPLIDGYLVHCAVLARGLDVLLLPRQVLLAGPTREEVGALSFVHGVPEASTVVGVTHAQDKRLRRKLLNLAGLSTPPGITFSSRGLRNLQSFIARHGFPVVLKEAIGENPSLKSDKISSNEELFATIARMKRRSEDHLSPARSLVTSAYAENLLNVHEDEDGHRIAAPGARLLVEKHVSGRYIRCLVCGDRVLASIEKTAANPKESWKVLEPLHDDFRDVALKAAMAIPGLAVASVDLVVEDPVRPREDQAYFVAELCERPRLESYMTASSSLASLLADDFLRYQAEQSSVQLQTPTDAIAVLMRAESLSEPHALLSGFSDTCNARQLVGFARLVDQMSGAIECHLQGAPSTIACVIEALMSGVHFGQRAMVVETRQTSMESYADFRVA